MVYDEIVGNIPQRAYVEWDTPGQSVKGTVLNVETSNDPYPNSVRISVRRDDDTIITFYAPNDLKGKVHSDDVGKHVEITYLGKEKQPNDRDLKKFRVMREVQYQRAPKKNGGKK